LEELGEIGNCLEIIEDVKSLPDEFFSTAAIQSKAFDLMAATIKLITKQVNYVTRPAVGLAIDHFKLSDLVRVGKQLVTKNQEKYQSAKQILTATLRKYNSELDQGHRKMNAKNLEILKSEKFICSKF
jgi:cytochrome c